jgi:hypothetical protein
LATLLHKRPWSKSQTTVKPQVLLKGWIGFLARSQNFTIELQNRPIPKLLSFSGNTFHSITGISNLEVWALKNSVNALLNSLTEPYKSATSNKFISESIKNLIGRPLQKLKRVIWSTTFVFGNFEL